MNFRLNIAAVAALGMFAFAPAAQAQLINCDLNGTGDDYMGAAVFGGASSLWTELARFNSPSAAPLFNEAGASTSVTVTYNRSNSGSLNPTGTYANLGTSGAKLSSPVTLDGLVAGDAYDLAIYSSVASSFTLSGDVETTSGTLDWSVLTQGVNYALYHTVADSAGKISFTGTSNNSSITFTAFQLQRGLPSAVPEPGSVALLVGMTTIGAGLLRKRRK